MLGEGQEGAVLGEGQKGAVLDPGFHSGLLEVVNGKKMAHLPTTLNLR